MALEESGLEAITPGSQNRWERFCTARLPVGWRTGMCAMTKRRERFDPR